MQYVRMNDSYSNNPMAPIEVLESVILIQYVARDYLLVLLQ